MEYEPGDWVERRHGAGASRFGRVQGRCHPDGDQYYVVVDIGATHMDFARDLRPAPTPDPLPAWAVRIVHMPRED